MAGFWGLVAGAALLVGAGFGYLAHISRKVIAVVMAFGSGVLLFSLALIVIELVEIRFPWRTFWLDWLTACCLVVPYLVLAALLSGAEATLVQLGVIAPQIVLSLVLFPLIARMVAVLDRFRLMRVRRID